MVAAILTGRRVNRVNRGRMVWPETKIPPVSIGCVNYRSSLKMQTINDWNNLASATNMNGFGSLVSRPWHCSRLPATRALVSQSLMHTRPLATHAYSSPCHSCVFVSLPLTHTRLPATHAYSSPGHWRALSPRPLTRTRLLTIHAYPSPGHSRARARLARK